MTISRAALLPSTDAGIRNAPLYRVDPRSDLRWDALLQQHPCASVFHTKQWLEALNRTYGYTPIAYTTSAPDAALQNALLFCRVDSWLTGRRLVSLPFSDHCDPLLSDPADALVSALGRIIDRECVDWIELRPKEALVPACCPPHRTFCFHRLDLLPDLDTLFNNLRKDSIQRKIRRAERERLVCQTGRSDRLLDEFWRLFLLTRRRHGVPPPPRQWFRNVLDALGPAALLNVAFLGRQSVAAVMTLHGHRSMVYKYGCSDARFHSLGGMPFLLWTAIQRAKREGLRLFDFGRSDWDNPGLIAFKDRWGASRSELTYIRFPASPDAESLSRGHGGFVKNALRRLPDGVFTSVGSLLYKHLG